MREELQSGNPPLRPGQWNHAGKPFGVFISCPSCGLVARLDALHKIEPDGKVDPSVVCVVCGWHKFVTLLGWNL